jgi:hypothetical protein
MPAISINNVVRKESFFLQSALIPSALIAAGFEWTLYSANPTAAGSPAASGSP